TQNTQRKHRDHREKFNSLWSLCLRCALCFSPLALMRRRFGFMHQLLCARLEAEDGGGEGEFFIACEVHVGRNYAPAVSRDAEVVAEENLYVASKRLLIDLVVDERAPAVGAARKRQAGERAHRIAAVVEGDVQRAVRRVNRQPSEELRLAVL